MFGQIVTIKPRLRIAQLRRNGAAADGNGERPLDRRAQHIFALRNGEHEHIVARRRRRRNGDGRFAAAVARRIVSICDRLSVLRKGKGGIQRIRASRPIAVRPAGIGLLCIDHILCFADRPCEFDIGRRGTRSGVLSPPGIVAARHRDGERVGSRVGRGQRVAIVKGNSIACIRGRGGTAHDGGIEPVDGYLLLAAGIGVAVRVQLERRPTDLAAGDGKRGFLAVRRGIVVSVGGHGKAHGVVPRVQNGRVCTVGAVIRSQKARERRIAAAASRILIAADAIQERIIAAVVHNAVPIRTRDVYGKAAIRRSVVCIILICVRTERPARQRERTDEMNGTSRDGDIVRPFQSGGRTCRAERLDIFIAGIVDVQIIGTRIPVERISGDGKSRIPIIIRQADSDLACVNLAEIGIERAREARYDFVEGDRLFAVRPLRARIGNGIRRLGNGKVDGVALRRLKVICRRDDDLYTVIARGVGNLILRIRRFQNLFPAAGSILLFINDGDRRSERRADRNGLFRTVLHLISRSDIARGFLRIGFIRLVAADIRPSCRCKIKLDARKFCLIDRPCIGDADDFFFIGRSRVFINSRTIDREPDLREPIPLLYAKCNRIRSCIGRFKSDRRSGLITFRRLRKGPTVGSRKFKRHLITFKRITRVSERKSLFCFVKNKCGSIQIDLCTVFLHKARYVDRCFDNIDCQWRGFFFLCPFFIDNRYAVIYTKLKIPFFFGSRICIPNRIFVGRQSPGINHALVHICDSHDKIFFRDLL